MTSSSRPSRLNHCHGPAHNHHRYSLESHIDRDVVYGLGSNHQVTEVWWYGQVKICIDHLVCLTGIIYHRISKREWCHIPKLVWFQYNVTFPCQRMMNLNSPAGYLSKLFLKAWWYSNLWFSASEGQAYIGRQNWRRGGFHAWAGVMHFRCHCTLSRGLEDSLWNHISCGKPWDCNWRYT